MKCWRPWSYESCHEQGLVGLVENVQSERSNVILGPGSRRLHGRAFLNEEHDGLKFRTQLTSFSQVNDEQASALFAEVQRMLGDVTDRNIADLYAGHGPIALRLAKAGGSVIAVERNAAAVRDGEDSARLNELESRVRFIAADAEQGLKRTAQELDRPLDAVVVDPPRRGLTPGLIDALLASAAERLVYVSCDPLTLVRDLVALSASFDISQVRGVDLFPRTKHLEAVALLVRK